MLAPCSAALPALPFDFVVCRAQQVLNEHSKAPAAWLDSLKQASKICAPEGRLKPGSAALPDSAVCNCAGTAPALVYLRVSMRRLRMNTALSAFLNGLMRTGNASGHEMPS